LARLGVGYLQGMNYVAGQLLAHVKVEWKACVILTEVFKQLHPWLADAHLQTLTS
jgi:hypothetical protein